ncbi:MAG: L,D-transpeptidase family protein [Pirellulales bacterium]|nr:L,D-transpeptidase family protein [Pirellulales bacterium]
MNTLRTLTVVVVLAAVAYGVYASLNNRPVADPPGMEKTEWQGAPNVELPGAPMTPALPEAPTAVAPPAAAFPAEAPLAPAAAPSVPVATTPPAEAPAFAAAAPPFEPAASTPPAPTAEVYSGGVPLIPAPDANAASAPPASSIPPATQDRYASTPAPTDRYATPVASAAPDDPTSYAAQTSLDAGPSVAASQPAGALPAPTAGPGSAEFDTAMAFAQAQLSQGQLAEAHLALSQWFGHPDLSAAQETTLIGLLDQVAGTVIYSRESFVLPAHQVQPGETLNQIAQANNVPWQLLAKINAVQDPQNLRAGEQLKVVRGPFAAVVEMGRHRMSLWVEGRYAGRFTIGVGKIASIPEGEFTVRGKVENPTYYGEQVIDADDPNNPLGERLIDLGNQLGIHGTNDPSLIGTNESGGTIALGPRDLEDVYDILSVGSTVVIRR